MKLLLPLLCLIFIGYNNLLAQNKTSIQEQYAIYDSIQTEEKVYMQTDRTLYQPGNSIWFRVSVVNSANCPSALSREIYVELLDPKGAVVEIKTIENKEGSGAGDLTIPYVAKGGIYTLRAYTYWMQNFDNVVYFEKKITVQKVVLPEVLMQLDFEQEAYGAGSQVMANFKARTKDNRALTQKKINFEVLVDGVKLCREVAQTNAEGQAYLVFELPAVLETTNILLNVQLNHDSLQESIARTVPVLLKDLDLQFFPEGGRLVANRVNRVAFKALNSYGKPVDIQAELIDPNQKVLATFESYHQGMGAFEFVPKEGTAYQVKLLNPNGIQTIWTLPKASSETIGLYLKAQEKEQLVLEVYNNNKALELVAQQHGKLFFNQKIAAKIGVQSCRIPSKNLPMGIVQLTVFDTLKRVLCERLVFVNKERHLELSLESDKASYLPREAVELTLKATDETGKGVVGNFALAVVNDKEHTFIDDKQDNILSYLLMSSDLKGKIHEPNFYFDPTEAKADTALDYVLLTHGWRRYDWSTLVQETPKVWADAIQFAIASDEISGYLKINRYLKGQKLILLSEKRPIYKRKKALMSTLTDKNGFFKFNKKGLKFPVFLTLRHNQQRPMLRVYQYSKAGLELVRKTDLKEPAKDRSTSIQNQDYSPVNLNQGQLYGSVWDVGNEEGLPFANVVLEQNGVQIMGTQTDFDGNYSFDSLGAGTYDLLVSYVGFPMVKTEGIPIKNNYKLKLDIEMSEVVGGIDYHRIPTEEFILMDEKEARKYRKEVTSHKNIDELILSHPLIDLSRLIASTATVNQVDNGSVRTGSNLILINGIPVLGNRPISESEIEEIQIFTPGVPAAYENERTMNYRMPLIDPARPNGSYNRDVSYCDMIVRSYRIPLIDQTNTVGGQTLSSADIIPGGGWNNAARVDYGRLDLPDFDEIDFEQVGK